MKSGIVAEIGSYKRDLTEMSDVELEEYIHLLDDVARRKLILRLVMLLRGIQTGY